MSKSASSKRWLRRHQDDLYVKRAQERGYRSRAVFKLQEMDRRYRLFKPGSTVIDLGAAPGAWSQYANKRVSPRGKVIASDLLPMRPVQGVEFIQGDFCEAPVFNHVLDILGEKRADVVMSDMAPNASGVVSIDHPRAMYLAELALDMTRDALKPGGVFLVKLFHGTDFNEFVAQARLGFSQVVVRKPHASRQHSREVYLLAQSKA
jgi:23S rRNA (uridine2552-2'-O)-methyltransferase